MGYQPMMSYRIEKPPLWKTVGTVFSICLIGLFVCVYLLFAGIKTHEEQLRQTEHDLQQTRIQLELTRKDRAKLQRQVNVLENLEVERGTLVPTETTEKR